MARKWLLFVALFAPVGSYGTYYGYRELYPDPPPIENGKSNETKHIQLSEEAKISCESVANLPVMPGQAFPAGLAWEPLRRIGEKRAESLEHLIKHRPDEFYELCLKRYEEQVKGYRLIFLKQERIEGELQKLEKLRIQFREQPKFSVRMDWLEGQRLAWTSLYVKDENDDCLLAVPNLFKFRGPVVARRLDSDDAKKSGRYPINEFGIKIAMTRVLKSMREAEKKKTLHIRYEGVVKLEKLGNRPCYKLVRTPYNPTEEDDINELTMYIDQEMLLQVGNVLKNTKGEVIAEYFFRDIELNPTFDEKQFKREGL